jgi:hypothetical protein
MRALIVTSGWALIAAGCTVSKVPYHLANPLVQKQGRVAVAVAVQDQRAGVIAGGRPDLVGLMRAGISASDVTTDSGEPLAADLSRCVRRGLQQAGYQVTPVNVIIRSREEYVVAQMAKTGAQRLLLVSIDAWESDSRGNKWRVTTTGLVYDVTVQVFDPQGYLLGRAQTSGRDDVGGYDPPETALPELYQLKLELLLNDRSIARALRAPGSDS